MENVGGGANEAIIDTAAILVDTIQVSGDVIRDAQPVVQETIEAIEDNLGSGVHLIISTGKRSSSFTTLNGPVDIKAVFFVNNNKIQVFAVAGLHKYLLTTHLTFTFEWDHISQEAFVHVEGYLSLLIPFSHRIELTLIQAVTLPSS